MAKTAKIVQLQQPTLEAFEKYTSEAEAAMEPALTGSAPFLWSDEDPARAEQVRKGEILAQFWSGKEPIAIPDGLIHDWIGAAAVPGKTVEQAVTLVQDYDNHKKYYAPDVIDSKLISRHGDHFVVSLRLLKKKILTVVLDTEHDVHYACLDRAHCSCRSHTTRIVEVKNPGKPKETTLPPDTGYGFLWRLYSYWRFAESGDGIVVECRAISLSRDIPRGLGWAVEPIIQSLPRDALVQTLKVTREALIKTSSPVRVTV